MSAHVVPGFWLMAAAAALFVASGMRIAWRQPSLEAATLLAGALAWLAGNLLLLLHGDKEEAEAAHAYEIAGSLKPLDAMDALDAAFARAADDTRPWTRAGLYATPMP